MKEGNYVPEKSNESQKIDRSLDSDEDLRDFVQKHNEHSIRQSIGGPFAGETDLGDNQSDFGPLG